jgi:hypothetical protein
VADLTDETEADFAVAISHDCDIANDDLDIEPMVEFIFVHFKDKADGNCTFGKNSRKLHLNCVYQGKPNVLELIASQKTKISKNILKNIDPNPDYEMRSSGDVLQSWLAARYRRHALPNSLVDRLNPVFDHMQKVGKKNADGILSFRLSYEPKSDLPPEEPYEMWLYIVYVTDHENYESMATEIAKSIKDKFPKLLEKNKEFGEVDLRECEAVSEMEFTLRDARDTIEYHAEHLSYRKDSPGPVI